MRKPLAVALCLVSASLNRTVTILFLILLSVLTAVGQQLSPADKFALNLQRNYQQNGYDIDVTYYKSENELRLKSDMFQDAGVRESLVGALYKDRQTLCGLGIWYLKVGYGKGLFSSDVMKSASLGCPAAKAARIEETKTAREELATGLNSPDLGVRVRADGTTLVCESAFFDDPSNRSKFAGMLLSDKQKLCDREFAQIQLKGNKQTRTVPISCK